MKRHTYSIMAAALLLAMGALLTTACSNEDTAIDNPISTVGSGQTIQFTATLAPKSGDGAQTRAITTGTDGEGKEILNVTWKKNEQIAIYYETTNGHAKATATVESVDSETGEATISATFAADAKDKGKAKFVFPASLHNGTGGIDESQLLNNQNGLLRTSTKNISKNFDAATAEGTIAVSGSKASVSGTVKMENRVCILKMTLYFDDGQVHSSNAPLQGGTKLIINDGDGRTYIISSPYSDQSTSEISQIVYRPFQTGDVIYVAMLPVDLRDVIFLSPASDNKRYGKISTDVTLEKGKFYRNVNVLLSTAVEVQLPAGLKDLSTGSITAKDGDRIIQSSGTSTANTITIPDGATVTLDGVNISATGSAGIICEGTANIILSGKNTVKTTSSNNPSIQAGGSGTMLTISGSGSLTATAGGTGAGIGSGDCGDCGDITIKGGTVTATGGDGAGIGSGIISSFGDINITGGPVTATGGNGAGIGSGEGGSCGDITITDGVSRVTASKGNAAACSIGRGHDGSCGKVTIGGTEYYNGIDFLNGGNTYLTTSPLVYEP